ncbi:hypothetical protein CBER1_04158 [Cercospora berteroae]|uniref:Uncharacterized protein n=1 Tax=Cercospora berteroae TaxID=357750 RepID=A0A2S6CN51_9PEZI|nr:hypothetical protein CBER1_04158 [Cercospora berteroae]
MNRDPERFVWRNGTMVMNIAHFGTNPEKKLIEQAQARELMEEIYSVPFESQAVVADLLAKENEHLAPYMFYEAVKSGHAEVTKAIRESGRVALHEASPSHYEHLVWQYEQGRSDDVVGLSEEERTEGLRNWLKEIPGRGQDLLFHAAVKGAKDIILRLLEIGIVPGSEEAAKWLMPLHAACSNGHLECAKLLVQSGMNINCRDEFGGTPLMRAAVGGQTEIVRWLLENGARPHFRESREGKYNALEYGSGKDVEIVRLLLDACGWSPFALMAAASFGQVQSFELIAQAASFPDPPASTVDKEFWNTLSAEQRDAVVGSIDRGGAGGSCVILKYLLSFVPKELVGATPVKEAIDKSLRRAAHEDHADVVRLLLDACIEGHEDSRAQQRQVDELLIDAAAANALETAKVLLDKYGANVNYRCQTTQTTTLYNATRNNHARMIELLANQYQADIQQASGKFANGPTALWLAVDNQHELAARALLACGGPIESISLSVVDGQTTRVFVSIENARRAPVRITTAMNPAWDIEGSDERFLCLEYPEGWPGGVSQRKSDVELKDDRDIKAAEVDGFVVV